MVVAKERTFALDDVEPAGRDRARSVADGAREARALSVGRRGDGRVSRSIAAAIAGVSVDEGVARRSRGRVRRETRRLATARGRRRSLF